MGFTYPNNSQDKTVVWETVPRDAGTVLLSQDIYWQWLLFSEGQVSSPAPHHREDRTSTDPQNVLGGAVLTENHLLNNTWTPYPYPYVCVFICILQKLPLGTLSQ